MEISPEPARFTAQDHSEVQGAKTYEREPEEACLGFPGEVAKPPIDLCNLDHNRCPSWGPLRGRKAYSPKQRFSRCFIWKNTLCIHEPSPVTTRIPSALNS